MKRLALVAAVMVIASCTPKDNAATDTTPAAAPAPAPVDTARRDTTDTTRRDTTDTTRRRPPS